MNTYSITQEDFNTIVELSKFKVLYFYMLSLFLIVLYLRLIFHTVCNQGLIFRTVCNQGHPNPLDGIQPAIKAALTKAYKEESKCRMVRAADLVTLPGMKGAPKKRIAAILEPADEALENGEDETLEESEEENSSETKELGNFGMRF